VESEWGKTGDIEDDFDKLMPFGIISGCQAKLQGNYSVIMAVELKPV
jgi:hypothetical protein